MSNPETPRRRRRTQPAEEPTPSEGLGGAAIRGGILVGIAVLIGLFLLQDENSSANAAGGPGPDVIDVTDETTTTLEATTTTALVARAEVSVLVANGTTVNGAAGTQTDRVKALGYATLTPTNSNEDVTASIIHFAPGFEGEAQRLAADLAPTSDIATVLLGTPAPVPETQGANLILIVGPDLAGGV